MWRNVKVTDGRVAAKLLFFSKCDIRWGGNFEQSELGCH